MVYPNKAITEVRGKEEVCTIYTKEPLPYACEPPYDGNYEEWAWEIKRTWVVVPYVIEVIKVDGQLHTFLVPMRVEDDVA